MTIRSNKGHTLTACSPGHIKLVPTNLYLLVMQAVIHRWTFSVEFWAAFNSLTDRSMLFWQKTTPRSEIRALDLSWRSQTAQKQLIRLRKHITKWTVGGATNTIQIISNFYSALVNHCRFTQEKLLMHNSRTTCPICTKQILFERAMTGLSCDQPTKTSSSGVFALKFLYYRR